MAPRPEYPASTVALTFGDVPGEYAAARDACVLLDATDRGSLRVRGKDARDFLHRILANDVRGLAPGSGNANLLLSPKGKVLHAFDLVVEEDLVRLSTPPGDEAALARGIDQYLFSEDVVLEPAGDESAPLELVGPAAARVVAALFGEEPPAEPHRPRRVAWSGGEVSVQALPVAGRPGLRLDGGPRLAPALWSALAEAGARPSGIVVRDSLRVEAGAALFGVDVDEHVYPQEARLEGAFSLEKGCYIGQEVVAKIDTYGGLNKRLTGLAVSHDDPVPRGARLVLADEPERELGLVTSWAYSFALDRGMVLAYVKRRHQEVGTRFALAGAAGEATIVPFPG